MTAGTFATSDGGSVVLQDDGDFTFKPAASTSCSDVSDSFDYTVSDQNTPIAGTDTGTVTIAITGCVWYVNNNDPGNAGTSTAPFDTLAQAQSSSVAGDTIFVFKGSGTTGYDAGIDLKDNQRLIGEAANLQVGSDLLHTGVPANRPTITDSNADVVNLASGNTVRGVQIDPLGTGGGISGGSGDNGGTIEDVKILDAGTAGTQPGLELSGTSGTWAISALEVSSAFGGVSLSNTGGTTTFGDLALTTTGATAAFALSNAVGATVTRERDGERQRQRRPGGRRQRREQRDAGLRRRRLHEQRHHGRQPRPWRRHVQRQRSERDLQRHRHRLRPQRGHGRSHLRRRDHRRRRPARARPEHDRRDEGLQRPDLRRQRR